jgi:hypothetical protein
MPVVILSRSSGFLLERRHETPEKEALCMQMNEG